MLSPGEWYKKVPRDPVENLKFRRTMLELASRDRRLQKAWIEACRQDLFLWMSVWVFQYNPKQAPEVGPFVAWDFQEAVARQIIDRLIVVKRSMVLEKSRELGATWLAVLVFLWLALFHDWKKFLFVSHNEEAVKADDLDSLFGKAAFVLDRLPGWMARGAKRTKKLGFKFPATNSAITGSATSERAGVGGRATAVLLDEFSKQQDDYKIWGQTADTGPRLVIGTHYGVAGCFFDLTRPESGVPKAVLHWSQHPEKGRGLYRSGVGVGGWEPLDPAFRYGPDFVPVCDGSPGGGPFPGLRSPWYDDECRERNNPRDVSMHLDIDPQGSASQYVNPHTIRALKEEAGREPLWRGELHYDRSRGAPLQLVPRDDGPLALWVLPDATHKVRAGRYAGGCDVATGTGATPSVASFGDAETGEQVAEFATARLAPEEFAGHVVALCRLFRDHEGNGALLAWEVPGPGLKFGQVVVEEYRYANVYYRIDDFDRRAVRSDKPGWVNAPKPLRLLLDDFRAALYDRALVARSRAMLDETLAFAYGPRGNVAHGGEASENDPSGARENHGDRVIAAALMWKMMCQLGLGAGRKANPPPEKVDPYSFLGRRLARQQALRESSAWH